MITLQLSDNITNRQEIEAKKLECILTDEWLKEYLIPVITQTSRVSIRMMDWLVTNYSKEKKITYTYKKGSITRIFDVHNEYKNTLDSYGRRLFDPFRRGPRVFFTVEETTHESTLGQLTFWWWAQTKGVFTFCFENAETIEKHMNTALYLRDKRKKNGGKRKRSALSKAPAVKCFIFPVSTTVNFNDK